MARDKRGAGDRKVPDAPQEPQEPQEDAEPTEASLEASAAELEPVHDDLVAGADLVAGTAQEPVHEPEPVHELEPIESSPELDLARVANAEQEPGAVDAGRAPAGPVAILAKVWPHGAINWDGEIRQANEVFEVDTTKHRECDFVALCKAGTLVEPT